MKEGMTPAPVIREQATAPHAKSWTRTRDPVRHGPPQPQHHRAAASTHTARSLVRLKAAFLSTPVSWLAGLRTQGDRCACQVSGVRSGRV